MQLREQLLSAALCVLAAKGYQEMTVEDIAEEAKLGTEAFYDEFADVDECVIAAYDLMLDRLMARVVSAYEEGVQASWPEGVSSALAAFLQRIAEHPELARSLAVEVPAAGPVAHQRYRAAVEKFVPLLSNGRNYSAHGDELPEHIELMAVGGAEAIIVDEIAAGNARQLPAKLPEILFSVLVPYLGPEDASTEMHSAGTPAG